MIIRKPVCQELSWVLWYGDGEAVHGPLLAKYRLTRRAEVIWANAPSRSAYLQGHSILVSHNIL